jgi:hypothetical protein
VKRFRCLGTKQCLDALAGAILDFLDAAMMKAQVQKAQRQRVSFR